MLIERWGCVKNIGYIFQVPIVKTTNGSSRYNLCLQPSYCKLCNCEQNILWSMLWQTPIKCMSVKVAALLRISEGNDCDVEESS